MKTRIMVVDDSRVAEIQLCKLLDGTDFEVAAYCKDGEEAIARYEEVQPDIVTMDIIMPGIDGLEATQILLQEHPGARIIMVSSLACDDTMDGANTLGARGFLYKPFTREELLEALNRALAFDEK